MTEADSQYSTPLAAMAVYFNNITSSLDFIADTTTVELATSDDLDMTTIPSNVTLSGAGSGVMDSTSVMSGKAFMVISSLLICIFIVVGNGFVLFVISRYHFLQTTNNMFVAVLAAVDSTMAISAILKTIQIIQPDLFAGVIPCRVKNVLAISNCVSSSLALLVISSSRYLGTFKPFAYTNLVTPTRVKVLLVFILAYPLLLAVTTTAVAHQWDPRLPCHYYVVYPAWAVWLFNLHFYIPLPIIAVIYIQIIRETMRHRRQIATLVPAPLDGAPATQNPSSDDAAKRRANLKLLWTFGIVVGIFAIGWCPYLVFCNIVVYNPIYYLRQPSVGMIHRMSTYMLTLNCMVNPIIYALRFKTFRQGFKLACRCSPEDGALASTISDNLGTTP